MEREVVITGDGSSTIHLPEWDEQYHSKHGAIQEAYHVFVKHGLHHFCEKTNSCSNVTPSTGKVKEVKEQIAILEIGFGTGLNAFITLLESEKLGIEINYTGVEGYPVVSNEILQLNYPKQLKAEEKESLFKRMHDFSWDEKHSVLNTFSLTKQKKFFSEITDKNLYNLIYFDAFGARVQPELWTETIFLKMYDALKQNGVLVTYAAKGSVRRAMQTVGFMVEKLPGPPGKREMLRATK
ncbi:tRNA U34 5-methylaminomethyl-2-thiouridine-forming methyltransferase MnmC [Mariniflexile fucanivorans]|uniref:tRNA U34 5-methylaminomethyl-2-thiouridine-forming methyltransferase MnmC n=1 Tax=Mariniflexile fucanivorans TaxID=264023 RepID=A0A4R1RJ28_9FLAO|nr:tRNA (5-methylaminomethyl-2-thiouridine)(34)-methyltransferase MnmD [Mariniflexile fucanivorans]TCL66121.1 tRNA U34 5-methylaminomethyl-2-thiouridine-forming methyltransferase MnmC [Mariniflexile fucanivorans]